MQEIKIITELCAEDRARLDKIIEGLSRHCDSCAKTMTDTLNALKVPAQGEILTRGASESKPPTTTPPEDKNTPGAEIFPEPADMAPVEPVVMRPAITLEQIQQKVVQLAAAGNGTKKAKVRAIISIYGKKVSDLKDKPEVWAPVWDALIDLERDG